MVETRYLHKVLLLVSGLLLGLAVACTFTGGSPTFARVSIVLFYLFSFPAILVSSGYVLGTLWRFFFGGERLDRRDLYGFATLTVNLVAVAVMDAAVSRL